MLLFILFHHCVVFRCVSILKITYPFYSWWMLRMSLGFCYYKQCYHEHSWTFFCGAYIHISVECIPNSGIPWSWCVLSNLGDSFLKFAADDLTYPSSVWEFKMLHIFTSTWYCQLFLGFFFLMVVVYLIMAFKIFLMINEIEYFCLC